MNPRSARVAPLSFLLLALTSGGGLAFVQGTGSTKLPDGPKPSPRVPQPYSKERIEAEFRRVDRSGKGWVSYRDLMTLLGVDRREFQVIDKSKDGRVSFEEFDGYVHQLLDNGGVLEMLRRPTDAPPASKPASAPSSRPADAPTPAPSGVPKFGAAADEGAKSTPARK
ncbi:MAG: hypothetical protein JNJ88_10685 [Planctomycetes bacterium]|nr:hypothetical protein [Planctomycetota bacterium]